MARRASAARRPRGLPRAQGEGPGAAGERRARAGRRTLPRPHPYPGGGLRADGRLLPGRLLAGTAPVRGDRAAGAALRLPQLGYGAGSGGGGAVGGLLAADGGGVAGGTLLLDAGPRRHLTIPAGGRDPDRAAGTGARRSAGAARAGTRGDGGRTGGRALPVDPRAVVALSHGFAGGDARGHRRSQRAVGRGDEVAGAHAAWKATREEEQRHAENVQENVCRRDCGDALSWRGCFSL